MKMMIKILLLLVVVSCNTEVPPALSPSYPIENPERITIDSLEQDTLWDLTRRKLYYPKLGDSIDYIRAYRKGSFDYWCFVMYNGDTLHKYYYCRKYQFIWKNKNGGI